MHESYAVRSRHCALLRGSTRTAVSTTTRARIATCAPEKEVWVHFRRASAGQHRQGSWRLDCAVVAQPRADLHRADRHGKRLAARGNLLGTALKRRAARLGSLRLPHKALHVRELGAEYEHTLLLLLAPLTGWLAVSDISVQLSR